MNSLEQNLDFNQIITLCNAKFSFIGLFFDTRSRILSLCPLRNKYSFSVFPLGYKGFMGT